MTVTFGTVSLRVMQCSAMNILRLVMLVKLSTSVCLCLNMSIRSRLSSVFNFRRGPQTVKRSDQALKQGIAKFYDEVLNFIMDKLYSIINYD